MMTQYRTDLYSYKLPSDPFGACCFTWSDDANSYFDRGFPAVGCGHQNVWAGPGHYYGLPAPHPLELIFFKYKEGQTDSIIGQYVDK